jgi:lipoyl(octanoyl) transferase
MTDEVSLTIAVEDLGRLGYGPALERQREAHAAVVAGRAPETILLVEHEPVVTIGRRRDARRNLVASEDLLRRQGVELFETDRGGDVTYHGPGQVVAYPIIRLNDRGLNLRQYVRLLERTIIDVLGEFAVEGRRDEEAIGVWVDPVDGGPAAKIAAIGVRASRWVTMHGLALNVDPDLGHFKLIVPCGLAGRPVTSMAAQLGEACPSFETVRDRIAARLRTLLAEP